MKRPEPIELENNLGPDAVTGEINRVPWMAYDVDEMDLYIAEKDAEIAELKDKCQMHDFFWEGCGFAKRGFKNAIAVAQYVEDLEAENAELKKKLMPCLNGDCILTCEVVEKYGKENAELKQKLEDVKASHYAEMVDAGMRERRLRRALWLARAERANDKARIFYFNDLETMLDIDGYSYDSKKKKGHKKLTARDWRITWLKVERKCRAMAERYGEGK